MKYTRQQLLDATVQLEAATSQKTHVCSELRIDEGGKSTRQLRVRRDTFEEVPYGEHGSDFLVIDPETFEIECGACAGYEAADATVKGA
jgi:hypothetical protein